MQVKLSPITTLHSIPANFPDEFHDLLTYDRILFVQLLQMMKRKNIIIQGQKFKKVIITKTFQFFWIASLKKCNQRQKTLIWELCKNLPSSRILFNYCKQHERMCSQVETQTCRGERRHSCSRVLNGKEIKFNPSVFIFIYTQFKK